MIFVSDSSDSQKNWLFNIIFYQRFFNDAYLSMRGLSGLRRMTKWGPYAAYFNDVFVASFLYAWDVSRVRMTK